MPCLVSIIYLEIFMLFDHFLFKCFMLCLLMIHHISGKLLTSTPFWSLSSQVLEQFTHCLVFIMYLGNY